MKKKRTREEEDREISRILNGLDKDPKVLRMREYTQHGKVSTYDHCVSVTRLAYRIDKALAGRADQEALLKGAMLHDFYLYDWHEGDGTHKLHGYHHADKAVENARAYFGISDREASVIWSHMWPLNLLRIPRSREAWIVCLADKIVSCRETLFERN